MCIYSALMYTVAMVILKSKVTFAVLNNSIFNFYTVAMATEAEKTKQLNRFFYKVLDQFP